MSRSVFIHPDAANKPIICVEKSCEWIEKVPMWVVKLYGKNELLSIYLCKDLAEQQEIFEFHTFLVKNGKRISDKYWKNRRNK